jgi:hypothetical protein
MHVKFQYIPQLSHSLLILYNGLVHTYNTLILDSYFLLKYSINVSISYHLLPQKVQLSYAKPSAMGVGGHQPPAKGFG